MDVSTRAATVEDIPQLVELMGVFYAESGFGLDPGWAARSFTALLADDSRGAVWIVVGNARPAGYVVLTVRFSMEHGGLDAFIDDLFVHPEFRRQGLGDHALRTIFAECRRRGLLALHVEVGEDNVAARSLYSRFGLSPRTDRRLLLTVGLATADISGRGPGTSQLGG